MVTPQQLDEMVFPKAVFGGYDMQSVDELLMPLSEDYKTLYKENAVLKAAGPGGKAGGIPQAGSHDAKRHGRRPADGGPGRAGG